MGSTEISDIQIIGQTGPKFSVPVVEPQREREDVVLLVSDGEEEVREVVRSKKRARSEEERGEGRREVRRGAESGSGVQRTERETGESSSGAIRRAESRGQNVERAEAEVEVVVEDERVKPVRADRSSAHRGTQENRVVAQSASNGQKRGTGGDAEERRTQTDQNEVQTVNIIRRRPPPGEPANPREAPANTSAGPPAPSAGRQRHQYDLLTAIEEAIHSGFRESESDGDYEDSNLLDGIQDSIENGFPLEPFLSELGPTTAREAPASRGRAVAAPPQAHRPRGMRGPRSARRAQRDRILGNLFQAGSSNPEWMAAGPERWRPITSQSRTGESLLGVDTWLPTPLLRFIQDHRNPADGMDYEANLELDRSLPSRGVSRDVLKSLKSENAKEEDLKETCCICLEKFERRRKVKRLPCKHIFHTTCIDKWLKGNAICPLCKRRITDVPVEPPKATAGEGPSQSGNAQVGQSQTAQGQSGAETTWGRDDPPANLPNSQRQSREEAATTHYPVRAQRAARMQPGRPRTHQAPSIRSQTSDAAAFVGRSLRITRGQAGRTDDGRSQTGQNTPSDRSLVGAQAAGRSQPVRAQTGPSQFNNQDEDLQDPAGIPF